MSLTTTLTRYITPIIGLWIAGLRWLTGTFGPDADRMSAVRRRASLLLDPVGRLLGRPLVRQCNYRDYVCTVLADVDTVEDGLHPYYQRNFAATHKYRLHDGNRQFEHSSWVYDPTDTDWQHHVYLFSNADGTTDLYGHREPSANHRPYEHLIGEQVHGDPHCRARDVLDENDLSYMTGETADDSRN